MDRGERVAACSKAQICHDWRGGVSYLIAYSQQHIGHDVPDDDCTRLEPLLGQVGCADHRRREQEIRCVVGQDPVDLLGHGAVEGAQPRLQVSHRHVQFDGRQRPGKRGVRVSVDQHPVREVLGQHGIHGGEYRCGLHPVGTGAHLHVDIGGADSQVVEEHLGQQRVVVLAGVDDRVMDPGGAQSGVDGGELDELRAGADDGEYVHDGSLSGSSCHNDGVRVLHVNNIARIGSALVRQGRAEGLQWDLYDIARAAPGWSPRTRAVRRAVRGARWEAGLIRRAVRADLLDIHGATVTAHTGWLRKPYTLHLHGTDIRVRRYEAQYADLVVRAVCRAHDVYYTTPDLAEHVTDLRPEATLQPVIVDIGELAEFKETEGPFRVLFPSRWDAAKGGDLQLDVLRALRSTYGDSIVMEGLQWGENASRAAYDYGVRLRSRMRHSAYARWLTTGSVAVGQMTGCMGVSELEAVGSGITTVMALDRRWYDGAHDTTRNIPVLGGPADRADMVEVVVEGVGQALEGKRVTTGRVWVTEHHSPQRAVARLVERLDRLGLG